MKRILTLLASLAAASTFATGCAVESSTNILAPTTPQVTASAPAAISTPPASSQLAGTWTSANVTLPAPGSCGNFQWQVTNATSTSMSGTFSATCSGGIAVTGSAHGELQGTQVPLTVSGTATYAGSISCDFSLSGTGTIVDNNTLTIPYSGTTCLGPVHGTETLHRPQPAAPPPPPPPPPPPADPLFGCGGITDHGALDVCIHDHINPTTTVTAFEVTKRMAWALRGEGAGLLIKDGGDNVVTWQGRNFFGLAHLLSGRTHLQGPLGRRRWRRQWGELAGQRVHRSQPLRAGDRSVAAVTRRDADGSGLRRGSAPAPACSRRR